MEALIDTLRQNWIVAADDDTTCCVYEKGLPKSI